MDENEINAVSEALEQLRAGGEVSAETLEKLGGTTQSANKALEGYTKKLLSGAGALGGMARSVADGEGSFKSLGSSITGLTGMIGNLASAIPLVGGAAKALAEGVGQAAKFVLDQLDIMAKNYQTLGDASAGAADGVDGLLRQFNQMGNYSLPAFTKAVKANTQGLASLSGTAALGAEELSKVSGVLTTGDMARRFLKLGISLDSVGDTTAEYLSNMSRYGLTQGDTTDQLTKKTQNYIVEVDKIARLTGQTRAAQEREAQKNLADAKYRAKISEMRANGQKDQAAQLELFVRGMGAINPALADAARATVTGTYLTQQAAETDIVLNGAMRRNIDAIEQGTDATTAIADAQDAAAAGADNFRQLFKYGKDLGGVGVAVFDTEALLLRRNELEKEGLSRADAIAKAQKEQMEASGKNTEEFVDANVATANASKSMQSLGFSLARAAIPAVKTFAEALDKTSGFIAKKFGIGGTSMQRSGVDHGPAGGPRGGQYANSLLDLIGRGESRGNYNALVGGGQANLTSMTIAEVQELQKKMLKEGRASSAVGKYQMISATLAEQVKKAGLDPNTTKFDEKTQDLLAQQLIDRAGYGKKDSATVMKNLAGTWASLPKDMSGRGAYDGYNTNQANVNPNDLLAAISGPSTRYRSDINAAKPEAAGAQTTVQGQQSRNEQQSMSSADMLTNQLSELNQTAKDILTVNKRQLSALNG
jgi:hypothetical protein